MKNVVIATDDNEVYSFFIPLTAIMWKRIADFVPLILLVGTEEHWNSQRKTKLAIDRAREIGADIRFINQIEGVNNANTAQLSRIYASSLDLAPDTYVMTSDMDMWPLSNGWFNRQYNELNIFFANAMSHSRYPICYIGANVKVWREIMHLEQGDISEAIKKQLLAGPGIPADSTTMWYYDEVLLTLRIKEWSGYQSRTNLMDRAMRALPVGRVDRFSWVFHGKDDRLIDAHLLRPGFNDYWVHLAEMLKAYLSEADYNWCVDYRNKFIEG